MAAIGARRIALVTGAAQGIGRAIVEHLAQAGMTVVLCDIQDKAVEAAAQELVAAGLDAHAVVTDVADEGSVRGLFAMIEAEFGCLDILINNAGVVLRTADGVPGVQNTPLAIWQKTMDVNLTGTFLVCRAAIPLLRKRADSRIVIVSSLVGQAYSDQACYYAASKAGVLGFARILAGELGPHGITVNSIAPGMIATPKIANSPGGAGRIADYAATTVIGRAGREADVCAAVAYLVSPEAGFMTGEIVNLNGGAFMP
jgi:3-oxoacyl-[acyl-carrier protein] reductase